MGHSEAIHQWITAGRHTGVLLLKAGEAELEAETEAGRWCRPKECVNGAILEVQVASTAKLKSERKASAEGNQQRWCANRGFFSMPVSLFSSKRTVSCIH